MSFHNFFEKLVQIFLSRGDEMTCSGFGIKLVVLSYKLKCEWAPSARKRLSQDSWIFLW